MECPRCGEASDRPVSCCTACGLTLEVLSNSLGSNLVSLASLTDAAHCLRVREREALQHELDVFQQTFPQIFFAVYLGVLPGTPSHSELAFWLLNHAAFHPADPSKLNERAAILMIDPVAKAAGMTVGYALEPHLPNHKILGLLRRIRTPLWHGEYAAAIELAIRLVGKLLRKSTHRATRQAEFPPPDADADFFRASGLQSLRDPASSQDPVRHGGASGSTNPA